MDRDLYRDATAVFDSLGLTTAAVITALYKRVVVEGRIPFEFKLTEEENARLNLIKTVYDSKVPTLTDSEEIRKYLNGDNSED
ncbi:hypothetical protein FC85_GL002798 [Lentilactobacillus diolivorans DSM 14421]|uniref:Addiction module antitoxin, RelB DinJ family n=2 Tax=Lentilactobacillus diolivorans TaxID=179838 RepID=A0A0R1SBZ9_9LACO|nr:hypothetical protein FC85_GL002798 [Lentilactobacillus diolivorans DSM 14421]